VRTRIPKLLAEINSIIADVEFETSLNEAERRSITHLLKQARRPLALARQKMQEADVKVVRSL
jgi:hypothetical protein